jgi:hypothetical protein
MAYAEFSKDGVDYMAEASVRFEGYWYGADADGNRGEYRCDAVVEDLVVEAWDAKSDDWKKIEWNDEMKGVFELASNRLIESESY